MQIFRSILGKESAPLWFCAKWEIDTHISGLYIRKGIRPDFADFSDDLMQ